MQKHAEKPPSKICSVSRALGIPVPEEYRMDIDSKLKLCYELMFQVADTEQFTARAVRGGYTHWLGPEFSKEIREFTGLVSRSAIENGEERGLVLEHFLRIQTSLTKLIGKHMSEGENVSEFISEVKRLEKVHIVTKRENDVLRKKVYSGDYEKAGIEMVAWENIPEHAKSFLRRKIRGKVANADSFL